MEDMTPEHDPFDPDMLDFDPDQGDIEVTPDEYGDNYVGPELLFPQGGALARGRVTRRKRDIDGNPPVLQMLTQSMTPATMLLHLTTGT